MALSDVILAATLNNLAERYKEEGRYADAEPLYKRVLAINEKAFGPDHPSVALALNDLAELYKEEGRYADAEPLYKWALATWKKALGPDHPDVAQSLNNLADLYSAQGRYADAEPLYKRALAIFEKALGPDHPSVASALNNLASLYKEEARYVDTEPLYKRALAIREKALGPDHPDVAQSLNNLASLYKKRPATPMPSRSTSGRWRSLRKRSAPSTPLSRFLNSGRPVQRPGSPRRCRATLQAGAGVNTSAEGEYPQFLDAFCLGLKEFGSAWFCAGACDQRRIDGAEWRGHEHYGRIMTTDLEPPAALPDPQPRRLVQSAGWLWCMEL